MSILANSPPISLNQSIPGIVLNALGPPVNRPEAGCLRRVATIVLATSIKITLKSKVRIVLNALGPPVNRHQKHLSEGPRAAFQLHGSWVLETNHGGDTGSYRGTPHGQASVGSRNPREKMQMTRYSSARPSAVGPLPGAIHAPPMLDDDPRRGTRAPAHTFEFEFGRKAGSGRFAPGVNEVTAGAYVNPATRVVAKAVEQRDFLEFTLAGGYPKRTGVDASIWMYQVARALKHNNTRPETKRNAQVSNAEQQLTAQFQGVWLSVAPGEAEAELGRLNNLGIIDIVMTTDIDALIFGAKTLMIPPNKKNDKDEITVYHSSLIFITPGVCLSRGGLLLIALLAGGDYHQGLPDVVLLWPTLSHVVLSVMHCWKRRCKTQKSPMNFWIFWRPGEQPLLGSLLPIRTGTWGGNTGLYAYTHPVTSWSENYSPPAYQSWGLPKPDVKKIASFCQGQFDWDAAKISSTFVKHLYSGIVMQSLLKPYDLHALLRPM
ncbi:hypothetical protein B0H11DRAFT_2224795 [Mycena galericulata]|nr:hypothetical protein B0H11DRAFT_2224795 [Mycena galericulata]